ncbi:MAG: leucine-rich repeat protein [Clostridia bacterium]|nr:leucine-rich repeat protein [Clostridia bacterium]
MSTAKDFVIKKEILIKYKGAGGQVIIPEGVTRIGDKAFSECKNLTSVVIPEGVKSIGWAAFSHCYNLTSVVIPKNVTSIGTFAFSYCYSLTSIVIPEGVTSIGDNAFIHCSNLTNVVIPESVTSIGDAAFQECKGLADAHGFVIVRGMLYHYYGTSVDVVIPEGVTSIADRVFSNCNNLTNIVIPAGMMSIGYQAFKDCKSLTSVVFPDSMKSIASDAFWGCESLANVVIPEGVTSIGNGAFCGCTSLTSVVIPSSVTSIGWFAFSGCTNLKSVVVSENVEDIGDEAFLGCRNLKILGHLSSSCKLGKNVFGEELSEELLKLGIAFWVCMSDAQFKKYFLNKQSWDALTNEARAESFLTRQGKSLLGTYQSLVGAEEAALIGEMLIKKLSDEPNAKDCTVAANFMTIFFDIATTDLLCTLYSKLKNLKEAKKALDVIEKHAPLMEKLSCDIGVVESLPEAEQMIMNILLAKKLIPKDIEKKFKDFYSLTFSNLPELQDANGKVLNPIVLAYLLTIHEMQLEYLGVFADYKDPGLCPEAKEIVKLLDEQSLQRSLMKLADANLGLAGHSKKKDLAYPICRYANEATMAELTKRAPLWRSSVSGDNAPPFATFCYANMYSNTRAAMLFADKYNKLARYAEIRNTTEDDLRDRFLSDVGVHENGRKSYDLGNQIVTAVLQNDFGFLIELPNGKMAKSLPKKGADEGKYAIANASFTEMKKAVKRIAKNRSASLFKHFLNGNTRNADDWKNVYLSNPILRMTAKLLVWTQDEKTFTLGVDNAINAIGESYTLSDSPIRLAHPMEMTTEDVNAWQKYFSTQGIKQPFEQIWEPIIDPASVTNDRYKDCGIPYYRFHDQSKRGITVEDLNFHDDIRISIEGCETVITRLDFESHCIDMNHRFAVQEFGFKDYTRRVNHIVAYLDRITVYDRIKKDDVSVAPLLSQFTLAQITEFIKVAQENNCTNVTAILLDFKNRAFADFDPMDEFTFEI